MGRALRPLGGDFAPLGPFPSDSTPQTPALYAVPSARLTTPEGRRYTAGCAIVASYWARTPYQGRLVPRLTWSVEPEDVASASRIHVLDLPPKLLRQALTRSPVVAELERGGRRVRPLADLPMTA